MIFDPKTLDARANLARVPSQRPFRPLAGSAAE